MRHGGGGRSSWVVIFAAVIVGAVVGGALGAALVGKWPWIGETLGLGPFALNLDVIRFSVAVKTSPGGLLGGIIGFIVAWRR